MGGPSYQTPYPVSDTKGGQVIWDWGTKSWGPYTAPKPGAEAPPGVRVPDSGGEAGGSNAPGGSGGGTASPGQGGGGGAPGQGGEGIGIAQVPKRRGAARRGTRSMSLPGSSLLMGVD